MTGKHLIDSQWRSSSGATFTATNPAIGEKLPTQFHEAGEAEVNLALDFASYAFHQTKQLKQYWQADLLEAIAARIMDLGDALIELGEKETALPAARLTGERGRTVNQLKMFASLVREGSWVEAVIDTADPQRQPLPKPDIRRMLTPRGPVVVFGASNFPFAFSTCGGDTASALAAGNPVVVKGHPSHPGTSEMFASAVNSAIEDLKLPHGLFALLQGTSNQLGGALVKHPATTAVGFTGSMKGGRALFDLAAARPSPIPVYAEMGSLNPLVILPAALAERREQIAKDLAGSVTMGVGQFCTKPGLIFTIGSDREFEKHLVANLSGVAPGCMLNRNLRDHFTTRATQLAEAAGVETLVAPSVGGHAGMSAGLFVTSAQNFLQYEALREEAFGPAALVIRCNSVDDLAACMLAIEGTLTASLHIGKSEDKSTVKRVHDELSNISGRVIINGYPTGVEVCHAMVHGGPYPATTDANSTSVGTAAIKRFVRMIAFQNTPDDLLPVALQNANPLKLTRMVNGKFTNESI